MIKKSNINHIKLKTKLCEQSGPQQQETSQTLFFFFFGARHRKQKYNQTLTLD